MNLNWCVKRHITQADVDFEALSLTFISDLYLMGFMHPLQLFQGTQQMSQ